MATAPPVPRAGAAFGPVGEAASCKREPGSGGRGFTGAYIFKLTSAPTGILPLLMSPSCNRELQAIARSSRLQKRVAAHRL